MSANGPHWIRWGWIVLTRVYRTRRKSVCEALRKYYGNVEHVEELVNVGKRSPSDLMETVCLTRVHQTCCVLVREILRKYVVMLGSGGAWKCRQTGRLYQIRWRRVAATRVYRTSSVREILKYSGRETAKGNGVNERHVRRFMN